jgi:Holliday junction resolvasome RuvABC endonuclease subunit
MASTYRNRLRVLGIDPSTKGFGYLVLEGADRILARGVAHVPSRRTKDLLARIEKLFSTYRPDVVAVEDVFESRRRARALREIERIVGYAHLRDIDRTVVSLLEVRSSLGLPAGATKNEVAEKIVGLLPELAPLLPPKRRLWESELERMNVFDAAAFALAAMASRSNARRAA